MSNRLDSALEYISVIDNSSGKKQKFNLTQYYHNGGADSSLDTDTETLEERLKNQLYNDEYSAGQFGGKKKAPKKEAPVTPDSPDSQISITISSDENMDRRNDKFGSRMGSIFGGSISYDDHDDFFWDQASWTIDTEYNLVGGKGEALAIYRGFVKYIQDALGVKGGIPMSKLGGYYMKKAKAALPGEKDMSVLSKKAKEIFDKDKSNAKTKYEEFVNERKK